MRKLAFNYLFRNSERPTEFRATESTGTAIVPVNRPSSRQLIRAPQTLPAATTIDPSHKKALCKAMASWFVRKDNRYYLVDDASTSMSKSDVQQVSLNRFKVHFNNIPKPQELIREVFQHAIETKHTDQKQTIAVWDGSYVCRPDISERIVPADGFVKLNRWKVPDYRLLDEKDADFGLLPKFLQRVFVHGPDRRVFLDWLSWSLQNEASKPRWAIFLYSRKKGTGKSTLCELSRRLFGEANSSTQNSVQKLTGKFNQPILMSKLVVCEEVKLSQDSPQGNTLKTYVTEDTTSAEAKGKEVQQVRQYCCFILTTNHIPLWIEADDRRYYVIDCDHEGHASGPQAGDFGEFMSAFRDFMRDDRAIAKLYNALMVHQQAQNFEPNTLNIAEYANPVMQHIQGASDRIQEEQIDEYINESGRFAIGQEELVGIANEHFQIKPTQIRHIMVNLRWRKETVKWGGKDYARAIWVHSDYCVHNGHVEGKNGYRKKIDQDSSGLGDFEVIGTHDTDSSFAVE